MVADVKFRCCAGVGRSRVWPVGCGVVTGRCQLVDGPKAGETPALHPSAALLLCSSARFKPAVSWRSTGRWPQSGLPVSRSKASKYFSWVLATTSGGNTGAGGVLFQLSVSR